VHNVTGSRLCKQEMQLIRNPRGPEDSAPGMINPESRARVSILYVSEVTPCCLVLT
jgi:hypothetical protein